MAVDYSQLPPDLSQSTVDFASIGNDLPPEQVNAPASIDPTLDPSLDPTQTQDQSASTVGLGNTNPGQFNAGLGSSVFDPRSLVGKNVKDVQQFYGPQGFDPHSLVGKNIKDIMPSQQMPQPIAPQRPSGQQQYGNDWVGNVLNWEQQNLPGPIRGFVHSRSEERR